MTNQDKNKKGTTQGAQARPVGAPNPAGKSAEGARRHRAENGAAQRAGKPAGARARKAAAREAAAQVRFVGISDAAAALGVERTHLWRVLTGRRRSDSLSARFRDYLAGRA